MHRDKLIANIKQSIIVTGDGNALARRGIISSIHSGNVIVDGLEIVGGEFIFVTN